MRRDRPGSGAIDLLIVAVLVVLAAYVKVFTIFFPSS